MHIPAPRLRARDVADVGDRLTAKLRRPRHAPARHDKLALAIQPVADALLDPSCAIAFVLSKFSPIPPVLSAHPVGKAGASMRASKPGLDRQG
jgi:hypothetical protein